MTALLFAAVLLTAVVISLSDWRRGWLLAVICGVLQDPVRKLTPGAPVVITMSIVVVYAAVVFGASAGLRGSLIEFRQRFSAISTAFAIFLFCLALAAANGLVTFGIGLWKVPALSLFIYLAPLPAALLGYHFMDRDERIHRFFRFYAIVTSIAMIGSLLEYLRVEWAALGLVAQQGDYIRHLPGIQIRMISGFYRAPDVMGWHAAMLTCIAIAAVVRLGLRRSGWLWMLAAGWGFFNCLISGRRKAVYFVAAFVGVFLWRYFRRLTWTQITALAMTIVVLGFVVHDISKDEASSVYAKGALASRTEISQRLEGGVVETFSQFGIMGAGLGTATQGVRHLITGEATVGWQEGGLGKLAVELGLPGLLAAAALAFVVFRTILRVASHPDLQESPQITRVTLFALFVANVLNFLASAQAYSDPVLTLVTSFLTGALFGTATLDERVPAQVPERLAAAPA